MGAFAKRKSSAVLPAALALSLQLLACGSSSSNAPAKSAAEAAPPPAPPAPPASTGPEQQFAISDAPTAAENAPERPKMSGAAATAYASGMTAFQNGDLQGAKAQFTQATQADSKAYQAFYSLGVVKERLGDTTGALSAYRQATLVVADYEPAIFAYSVLLARSGRSDEAVEYINGRLAAMPKSAAVSAAMAEIKSIQGDSGAAQRYAQEALKKNPDYRPAMVTIARDHYRSRRLDLALYSLKGILDGYGPENPPRDKNNAEAHLIRGLIYKEQNLRGPAMEELKKALDLRPDLVEARVHLATYLLEAGNPTEAAPLLEGALRYQIDHVIAHLNLGDAYRLLGKVAESRRELE
ncbi:MAG TPA: tetratricopeptide repeat protein, partial [Polyangiaceae bacterium]|nr:tetratricopeptide repeat protein [Polyangiaceae bacterium]